jgi:hypothetical protein
MSKFAKTLSIWMLLCGWASAQTSGTISGYTKDPTGSFVPNVKVTVTNEKTGATRSATSDASGFYQVLALVSGVYTIEAEAQGFKKFRNTGVALTVDENVRADVALEIGQMTEAIEVTAQAALIDTRSSQTSATIDDRRLVDLPLAGRNVFRLAATLPGILAVNAPTNSDLGDARTGPGMNVNGARANMNYNRFNGTYFNNPSRNTGMNVPPPDAIQEFKVQTSNFAADSGRNPGANVTIVSRQGTNTFHGALWEFHRNDNLNARSFFQTTKPQLIQNQYGASAGGPIIKDKAFVFGTFEIIDDRRQAATTTALPPTSAEVAGNFSHLTGTKQLVNPFDNTPFPNNQIPTSLFDPAARKVLEFLPVVPGGSIQAVGLAPRDSELYMVRGDVNLTPKQNLFGHYYFNQNKIEAIGLAYSSNIADWTSRTQGPRVQNVGINHTYTISPTLLSQLTLGYTRSYSLDEPTVTRLPSELGIQGMPVYTNGGSPQFTAAGRFSLASGGPVKFASNVYQVQEHLSFVRSRHTIRVGFEYLDLGFFQSFLGPPGFSFNGQRTGGGVATRGDPMADFLLGAYQQLGVTNGVRNNDGGNSFTVGFIHDDFKLRPNLTLNLGLRYELPTPWVDKFDRINTVVPDASVQSQKVPHAPPGMLFPGDLPRGLYNTDKNNFAPRFGFAWDVSGNGRTAVRGAYGIFYDTFNTDTIAQENPPFVGGGRTFVNGLMSNPFDSVGLVAPPAFIDPNAFTFVYPINGFWSGIGEDSLRTTYVQEWNLSISQELGRDYALTAAYIGKTGRKIIAFRPFNAAPFIPGNNAQGQPISTEENAESRAPFLPGIYGTEGIFLDNSFTSAYHSVQIEVDKRFSGGLQFNSSYTLGKSIDSSSTTNLGACLANPFNVRDDRGRSSWDRRHAFVVSGIWSLPAYASQSGALGKLLGGWSVSGISYVQSGSPVTIVTGQNTALDGNICGGDVLHADLVGSPERSHSSRDDMRAQFFNRDAFVLPQLGRYGTAGRSLFSGPALVTTDLAILKDIMVREGYRFQLRAEFTNAFNQVNFNNPVASLSNARYGQITGSQAGRAIQVGLKFVW